MDLPTIIKTIEKLITPCAECKSLEDAFEQAATPFSESLDHVKQFKEQSNLQSCASLENQSWWKYVTSLLDLLLLLRNFLKAATGVDSLISIKQKKQVESSIQILISLGILPNLSLGYGVLKEKRSSSIQLLDIKISTQEKTYSIGFTLRGILVLCEEETLREIVMKNHLGDVLAALFHVLLVEKPEDSQFGKEREYYKRQLVEILQNYPQPQVIRELMILYGSKECPARLSRVLQGFLTERLMSEGGVLSTIRGILDVAGDSMSPHYWSTVGVIGKLIVTPHAKDKEAYFINIKNQVWPLLSSSDKDLSHVAVTCIKLLYEKDASICQKYFLIEPFKIFTQSLCEDEMSEYLQTLHKLFISSSDNSQVDSRALVPHSKCLLRMHFLVHKSVSLLKDKVEDLFWCSICGTEDMKTCFEELFFDENDNECVHYEFGDNGGIVSVVKTKVYSCEDLSQCFVDLVNKRNDHKVKIALFHSLVRVIAEGLSAPEKTFLASNMLSVLCTDPQVLEGVLESPSGMILLLKSLIEENKSSDTISLLLMAMTLILGDTDRRKEWNEFGSLIEPLRKLKDSDCGDLSILAEEVYCLILTHGVVDSSVLNQQKTSGVDRSGLKPDSPCNKAMIEAGDDLLPVRGHGLRELAMLVLRRDKEALAKKEMILGIFQENLKDEDSYIYLSAINGLSALATVLTDQVLHTLTEEYTHCKDPQLRLKIGEVLLRAVRYLGDMVPKYKAQLINCFLCGVRDEDHLVRASSLSNLGELCKLLSFRVGVLLIEIFECIRCIISTDKAPEPRRAAVLVVTLLIGGLGPSALSILEPVLLDMYRSLKILRDNDEDFGVRLHAQLALEQLESCTLSFLFPKIDLKKKIIFLDPPM